MLGNGFDPARIYAARSPGVVTVFAFFDKTDPHGAQGSGFVVSDRGYILTSAHVITNAGDAAKTTEASRVFIGFRDGDRVKAEIIGWDVYDDVALLRVAPGAHALAPVPLGDSSTGRAATRSRRWAARSGTRTRSQSASSRRCGARSRR